MQPVRGTVTLPGGKSAAGSMVVFESQSDGPDVTARGDVKDDGTFIMSTQKPGDGVPPGKYRVAVMPPPMVNAEAAYSSPFHPKYSSFDTSGLQFEVQRGRPNELTIQVTK
jgi:hypothetical protein